MKTKSIIRIAAMAMLTTVFLTGCQPYYEAVAKRESVTNLRIKDGGYIMYEIENGTVTCREHTVRSELTCWKNSN
jgi:hypothetical protein